MSLHSSNVNLDSSKIYLNLRKRMIKFILKCKYSSSEIQINFFYFKFISIAKYISEFKVLQL